MSVYRDLNIPNCITIGRLFLVPIITFFLIQQNFFFALILFVLAGVSDAVDGYIAKRFDATSKLGTYLDPLADKALLNLTFIILGALGHIPLWLVVLILARDLFIIGGVLLASFLNAPMVIRPIYISKITTFLQVFYVLVVMVELSFGIMLYGIPLLALVSTGVFTLLSAGFYLYQWMRHMLLSEQMERF